MEKTFLNGDVVLVTKWDYIRGPIKRGDVVICNFPNRKERFIKRIIGLPGENIAVFFDDIKEKSITYIDGMPVEERYLDQVAKKYRQEIGPVCLKENEYFLMGDNRRNSVDSRNSQVGVLSKGQIRGKVRYIIFPFKSQRNYKI